MSNNKQRTLDYRYLRMAKIWAENSYCKRRKVGALVVKDQMIISDGYNGTPSGFDNVCEDSRDLTLPYVPKPTPSPSWHEAATTAMGAPSTSPLHPASNVPSSSSRQASSVLFMPRNTVWKTASHSCNVQE